MCHEFHFRDQKEKINYLLWMELTGPVGLKPILSTIEAKLPYLCQTFIHSHPRLPASFLQIPTLRRFSAAHHQIPISIYSHVLPCALGLWPYPPASPEVSSAPTQKAKLMWLQSEDLPAAKGLRTWSSHIQTWFGSSHKKRKSYTQSAMRCSWAL